MAALEKAFGLNRTPADLAVMIWMPANAKEECLILRKTGAERPTYRLLSQRAKASIWVAMPEQNGGRRMPPVQVTRWDAPLDRATGQRLDRVWEAMLRGTRFPERDSRGLMSDGETVEFRYGFMYGEAIPPIVGPAALLVDLGRALIDYCQASEAERPGLLKTVESRLARLERDLAGRAESRGGREPDGR
jgi:hypothetical protein